MRIDGTGFRILHHFDKSKGKEPHGTVVFDGASTLLGMTRLGGTLSDGSEGAGVIFRYDLTTGEYKVLHVFAKNASDNGDTNDHGFLSPAGGYYYGTTELGGKNGQGVHLPLACRRFRFFDRPFFRGGRRRQKTLRFADTGGRVVL